MSIVKNMINGFYCLPIPAVLLILALFAAGYLLLRERMKSRPLRLSVTALFLAAWLAVLLAATLLGRSPNEAAGVQLIPFYSYVSVANGADPELFRSNLMNAVLFFPAGVIASAPLCPRKALRILVPVAALLALSVVTELCQYRFHLGVAQTDDVIHNALGALVGVLTAVTASGIASHYNRKDHL